MHFFHALYDIVLEPMSAVMLLLTGVLAGIKTGAVVFRQFGKAMCLPWKGSHAKGSISSFGAAMTALAGTLGTGNIIGVAAAIKMGGPGAVFWMAAAAWIGMSVKYVEIYLACKTRVKTPLGLCGGPMYYIKRLLHAPKLAGVFAVCCILTSFGIGNLAQSNAAGIMIKRLPLASKWQDILLLAAAVLFALVLYIGMRGGEKRVSAISSVLTPMMAAGYLLGCLVLLFRCRERIPGAVAEILKSACGVKSAVSGISGAIMLRALKTGLTRGLFTNESGLGSAPIVHAAAEEDAHTAGLWGVFEVFFDTVVMCSITGLTLLVSAPAAAQSETMAADAFASVFGIGGTVFLSAALWLFALAAALGWGFYGSRSLYFLTGERLIGQKLYALVFALVTVGGFFAAPEGILFFSDLANAVMLLLNTVSIFLILCVNCTYTKEIRENTDKTRKIKRL